jgi:hypothetical protein
VKYADDLALLAKKEMMLQGMIDKLNESGRGYGITMNVEKTTEIRIPTQSSPETILVD